ncbi:putative general secretion pathway protein L [Desulfitobacterium hafniense DP7]|uniref:Putative general secretion pathway protein L n=1 Tax=Desulfitobacterium hafniense DP7 TaxID=537010 RepID=G9XL32_DESHA|nr:PilN domain-containing protein [Desulfitobacterium hafniense]EHL07549.1 putative general secretion pathway protein L [Desulfitobacterium hafniense DP7]
MMLAGQGRVCVELTDHELRWLWYTQKGKDKEALVPAQFEITPLPKGLIKQGKVLYPETLLSILRGYLEQRRVDFPLPRNPKVGIGLPLQNQFIREYHLPWVKKGHRTGLLRYLAEEEIPIPEEELVYDYSLEEEKGPSRRLRVVLSGIRNSVLSPVIFCFRKAGFEINKVCFSQLAWGKVMGFGPEENTLLLREDEGQIQYVFYKGGIPEIVRSFPATLQYFDEGEWKHEIHRMLLYLSSPYDQMEFTRILWSQDREAEKIGKRIGEYIKDVRERIPVLQGVDEAFYAFWGSQPLNALAAYAPEKYLAVLGLALEDEKLGQNNFWRTENLKKKRQRIKRGVAGVLLLVSIGGLRMLVSTQQTLDTLRVEAQRLSEITANQTWEREKETALKQTWDRIIGNPTAVGQEIRELTAYAPEGIYLERIEIKGRTLLIQGLATESLEVQRMFQQLKAQGWGKVQLAKYQTAGDSLEDSFREGMPIQFVLKAEEDD